ncbi:voltage-dependent anion channel [Tanacetum coccineum]
MEHSKDSPEVLPSLIGSADSNQITALDDGVMKQDGANVQFKESNANTIGSSVDPLCEQTTVTQSVSISMPPSPLDAKRVLFKDDIKAVGNDSARNSDTLSGSIATGCGIDEAGAGKTPDRLMLPVKNPRMDELRDNRYNSFKTWSGRLERQLSTLRGKSLPRNDPEIDPPHILEGESLSVDRYFDALEGPELETLRPSEEIMLPEDKKWPFLLRYPISSFGICLGVSSQAIMWKNLASTASTHFLHISLKVNYILWCISILLFAVVATTYLLKIIFYFEAVRREYYHPIRVNFFFAPWIALLFLAIGVPDSITTKLPHSLWYVLMTPIFILELKIYGQWMSGGQRRLSKVANPSNHLSVVGNFVGALLGASMGLKEGPIFFFAVGLAHYTVLFVTLYQRLPTNETLPKELHPVFFLFVAAPSVASMAWAKINGSFDYGSRLAYFIALFLYFSLAVRVNFFRGFKFSLAWWAYTFPMTGAAIATIRYSSEVPNIVTKGLSLTLSSTATLTVTGLLITTIIHAFVLRDLFPNDIGIAISERKPKAPRKWFNRNTCGSAKDIEHNARSTKSGEKIIEVPVISPGLGVEPFSVRCVDIWNLTIMENNQETDVSDDQNVSIKMPTSPPRSKKVAFKDEVEVAYDKTAKSGTKSSTHDANLNPPAETPVLPVSSPKSAKTKAIGYKSFKTFVSRPEIKFAVFCAKLDSKLQKEPKTSPPEIHAVVVVIMCPPVAKRERQIIPSEQIMLPEDQEWPFLLRYPVTTFGICLGVSSQAMLWKNLASNTSTEFLNISPEVNRVLWFISVLLFAVVASTYLLKMILYFKAVQREYYHPVRINFFFAPWVVLLFLTIGVPPSITTKLPPFLWYVLMAPIFFLELKLYGQWMSGGKRRLSKVANPSNHLSVVGNFVGAYLGATMGLKEGPLFFFAVGLAHYTVLFVTLYQRLPTAQTLPKKISILFSFCLLWSSVGSRAWSKTEWSHLIFAQDDYFIAFAFRIHFFRGFKFSLTWWAYKFQWSGAAIADIINMQMTVSTLARFSSPMITHCAINYKPKRKNTECKNGHNPGGSNSDTKSDTKDWKVSETTQDSCAFPREK